jgi:hypothetical protein
MGIGSLVLAAGMAATVATLWAESVTGVGFGVAFMGAIRLVSTTAPVEHRASVMSAFYVVAYLSLSIPTVIAGLVVPALGIEPTFRIFGLVVVGLAIATAAGTRHRAIAGAS